MAVRNSVGKVVMESVIETKAFGLRFRTTASLRNCAGWHGGGVQRGGYPPAPLGAAYVSLW